MNAGAYGGEIAHILVSAQVLTKTVIFVRLMQEICVLVIVVRCSKKQVKWLFQLNLTSNQETTSKSGMR